MVNELTTNMQPRCVGRYLINLPANLKVVGSAKINGIRVESKPQPQRAFELEMQRREAELKATKSVHGYQFLYHYGKVGQVEHSRYFVSLGSWGADSDIKRVIEAYKWDRDYQISVRVDAADSIHAEYTKKYQGTPYGIAEPMNDVPQKLRQVFDLIDRLQGRSEDMIPTEPGTCFVGGFLAGKAISEDEEISSGFALPDKPDVMFDWTSSANLQVDDTLIPRIKGSAVQEPLKAANGRVIRLDSFVSNGGIKADEALLSGLTTASPPVQGQFFSLETNYQGSASAPRIVLDMTTGYSNFLVENHAIPNASLSDAEAVALWDAVTRTLRPRPNGF